MAGDRGKYNFNRKEEIHRRGGWCGRRAERRGMLATSRRARPPSPLSRLVGMKHESPGATTPVFRLSRAGNPPHTSPSRIKRNEERTGIIIILVDRAQEERKRKV